MSAESCTDTVKSLCAYCGVGCGIVLQITTDPQSGRRHIAKSIGRKDHPANRGRLCTKGATTTDVFDAPGRTQSAYLRTDRSEPFTAIHPDTAITQCAKRLRAMIDEHGPDAVALYVSGQMSMEAQYLANKLAKGFIRTNQIESNRAFAWPVRVRATRSPWARTDRRGRTTTSTGPTSSS